MKTIKVTNSATIVDGFPHQLLHWQNSRSRLQRFIEPFIKYDALDKVIIVELMPAHQDYISMFSLFTTGELLIKTEYGTMDGRLRSQKEKYL